MRYAFALLLVLVAAYAWSQEANAVESPRALATYCEKLERGTKGAAPHIRIPNTKEAVLCWGYMASGAGSVRLRGRNQDYGIVSAGVLQTDPFILLYPRASSLRQKPANPTEISMDLPVPSLGR